MESKRKSPRHLPVYLDRELHSWLRHRALDVGLPASQYVVQLIRRDRALVEAAPHSEQAEFPTYIDGQGKEHSEY